MVRIGTNQFKNGITIIYEGKMFDIVEFQFVKPGKGTAFVRTRMKNIKTGKVIEYSLGSNDMVEQVNVEKTDMEYLYRDGESFVFMDTTSFEQTHVEKQFIEPILDLLKENTVCVFKRANGELISVTLPDFMILEVVECDPFMKGATASGGPKPAKVETGATVNVPPFINLGEKIKIDTRTLEYVERA